MKNINVLKGISTGVGIILTLRVIFGVLAPYTTRDHYFPEIITPATKTLNKPNAITDVKLKMNKTVDLSQKQSEPKTIYEKILKSVVPKRSIVLTYSPIAALQGHVLTISRNVTYSYLQENLRDRLVFITQKPDEPSCCGLWPEHWFKIEKYVRDLNRTLFYEEMAIIPWIGALNKVIKLDQLHQRQSYRDGNIEDYLIDLFYQLENYYKEYDQPPMSLRLNPEAYEVWQGRLKIPRILYQLSLEKEDHDTLLVVADMYEQLFNELETRFKVTAPADWRFEYGEITQLIEFYDDYEMTKKDEKKNTIKYSNEMK